MKEIPLTQGFVALVDDADFESLNAFKWHAVKTASGAFYAVRTVYDQLSGRKKAVLMHRVITDAPEGVDVDHRDGSRLNNQRHNLRCCTHLQNTQAFRKKRLGVSSQFRGVSWSKGQKKWNAHIRVKGEAIYLGQFLVEKNAALEYDKAAREFFGEFAAPNFPTLCREK